MSSCVRKLVPISTQPWAGAVGAVALATLLLLPPIAADAAAQTGTVTGQVVSTQTLRPVNSAQVFIPALNIGTLSRTDGRFVLTDVPAGSHTLRIERIGSQSASQEITVQAGGTLELEIQLRDAVLDLDEIVVTGTGAPTQRRRLGQTITTVTSDDLLTAPVTSVAQALQGRVSGAQGLVSGGQTGAGSRIILRGTSSISQRQDPVIYVDGVRMDNSRESASSVQTDRLQDINPQDIERVEVIKGAAAATLFGTEASSGVIQIFTRRGRTGAPSYSFSTDHQHLGFPRAFEDNCAYDRDNHNVVCDNPYGLYAQTGFHQNYNLSVSGGTPGVRYYVSGRLMNEVNPSPNNELSNQSIRASFDFTHTDRLSSNIDVNIVRRDLQTAEPGWGDVFGNLMLGNPLISTPGNPHGTFLPFQVSLLTEQFQESQNSLVSASLSYEWAEGFTSSLQVGHNFIDSRQSSFFPQGMVAEQITGTRSITNRRFWATTIDANTNWERQLTQRLMGNITVGGQSFWEGSISESASVREFGSPTLKTLGGGAQITGVNETHQEVINAGVFVQGQLGLDDRFFLTLGGRADGNSAFGEDFGMEIYPKAGLSWVVSEHDFWNLNWMEEFRLRGAIGSSGLQPGAFDAQRTWNPNSSVVGGYLTPSNLGNPDLKPERSTELELALEAGMFNGRFGAELVYFNQTTSDALLPVPPSPGTGFTNAQLMNMGTLKSWGLELMTRTRILDRQGFTWDFTLAPTYLDQWVDDMGGLPDRRLGSRRRFHSLYEGMWPGIWIAPIVDPNQPYVLSGPIDEIRGRGDIAPNLLKAADGTDSLVVIGRPLPNWTVDMGSTFQIGNGLTIRNIFEGAGGFVVSNETDHLRMALGNSPLIANLEYALNDPNTSTEEKQRLVDEYGRKHNGVITNTMYAGDYLRWAEASISYQLPLSWASRIRSNSTIVSVGVRNVHVFSSYFNDWKKGWQDPGTRGLETGDTEGAFVHNVDYLKTPTPRRIVLSLRTQF